MRCLIILILMVVILFLAAGTAVGQDKSFQTAEAWLPVVVKTDTVPVLLVISIRDENQILRTVKGYKVTDWYTGNRPKDYFFLNDKQKPFAGNIEIWQWLSLSPKSNNKKR